MNTKTLFSHNTDHWKTPTKLYKYIMETGYIDPCPFHSNKDNLNELYENKKIYINPPYSQIDKWTKFIKNNINKNEILLLIPARTDTKYFHELLELKPTIKFIKGRLKSNDIGCAPFPSIFMIFKPYYRKVDNNTYETFNDLDWQEINENIRTI